MVRVSYGYGDPTLPQLQSSQVLRARAVVR